MVSLVEGDSGLIAYPSGKGSGAITAFSQADGFLRIDALSDQMPAGVEAEVTLFTPHVRVPDLVIVGSHCTGLDIVTAPLAQGGLSVRSISVGSLGGLAAARRGECDIAPIHLFDEKTDTYNVSFLAPGLELIPGIAACKASSFELATAALKSLMRSKRSCCNCRLVMYYGEPKSGRRNTHSDRPASGRGAAGWLLESTTITQCRGSGRGAKARRLGNDDRTRRPCGRTWLYSVRRGALRLCVGDIAQRASGRAGFVDSWDQRKRARRSNRRDLGLLRLVVLKRKPP